MDRRNVIQQSFFLNLNTSLMRYLFKIVQGILCNYGSRMSRYVIKINCFCKDSN